MSSEPIEFLITIAANGATAKVARLLERQNDTKLTVVAAAEKMLFWD